MSAVTTNKNRVERVARLQWVPIALTRVSPLSQRELNKARVDRIVAAFDPEQIGTPTVSKRGDYFYIIDGQHRIEAFKEVGWGDQQVQCWTYEGLSEEEEAERFLKLNDTLAVNAFSKFRIGVNAGRVDECDIDRIVRAQNLRISHDKRDGSISAVGTLRKVYKSAGPANFAKALRIIRDAYGQPGLEAAVIEGMGLFVQRYAIGEELVVGRLAAAHGGVNGLLGKAEVLRKQTGNQRGHCVAAAIVDVLNAGRGGNKVPSWWAA